MRLCMALTALHITDIDNVEGEGTEGLISPKKIFLQILIFKSFPNYA